MADSIKNKELIRKKERLIALAATSKFIEKGFHKTSVREIAKEAGLTIGNLYDYVTSKDDILYLVYKEFFTVWSGNLLKDPNILTISDPKKQLCAAIESMLNVVSKTRDLVILAYRETKYLRRDHLKEVVGKKVDGVWVKILAGSVTEEELVETGCSCTRAVWVAGREGKEAACASCGKMVGDSNRFKWEA